MIIYYLAAIYPGKYRDIVNKDKMPSPAYKFNRLLAEGFAAIPDVEVRCIVPKVFLDALVGTINSSREIENAVTYIYAGVGEKRHSWLRFLCAVIEEIKGAKRSERVVLVCDALSTSFSFLCLWMKWLYRVTNVAIVTDFPIFMNDCNQKFKDGLWGRTCFWIMKRFDRYVLLTKYMGEVINKRKKPECIMEGVCDDSWIWEDNGNKRCENEIKVCLYAGTLQKEYGIDMLVKAFMQMSDSSCELHIYGDGNYRRQLERLCRNNERIHYYGVKPTEYIVEEEHKATLLVNPRPISGEYTQYSFPSKTLEYMASGTPVLMTKLPGLPESYYPYVYFIEEETVDGYRAALEKVLSKTEEELFRMGRRAHHFVIENKSADKQARRIFEELKLGGRKEI